VFLKNKNKYLGILIVNLLFAICFATLIMPSASAETVLEVKVDKELQSGKDYSIPLKIKVSSEISSEKLQLQVILPEGVRGVEGQKLFTKIEANTDYDFDYHVIPEKEGTYRIFVEGQLWEAQTNYKAIDSVELTINENRELVPVSEKFIKERKNANLLNTIKLIVILSAIVSLLGFAIIRFKIWLDAEDKYLNKKTTKQVQ
jgi:hypothetical protein